MLKEKNTIDNPLLDVIMKCACGALDQTDCNYIVALFGRDDTDCKIASITLQIEDEQAAIDGIAKAIQDQYPVSHQLLRIVAGVIKLLPMEIWQSISLGNDNVISGINTEGNGFSVGGEGGLSI